MLCVENTSVNSDSLLVQQYMNDIRDIPLLDEESEKYYATMVQEYNDEAARNMLVTSNLRFVILIAKQYRNNGVSFADLIGEGNLGLLSAIERYSPQKNVRFVTYAFWWIRQSIIAVLASQSKAFRLPSSRFRDLYNVKKIMNELEGNTDWYSQVCIVAKELGLSIMQISKLYQASIGTRAIEDTQLAHTSSMPKSSNVYYTYHPDASIFKEDRKNVVEKLFQTLSTREYTIMCHRYGLFGHKKLTLSDIGTQIGVSRERVRQIESQTLFKLSRRGRKLALQEYIYN